MFIYLVSEDICKRTARVSLDLEKCVPRVATYTEGMVEPPLWYKVLVLDSILVDCDRKKVFWSCDSHHEDMATSGPNANVDTAKVRAFFENKEQMFKEIVSVELDPTLEELFETAENIYGQLSPEVFDREGNVSTYKDLLKLLHVFLLPHIEFHQNHGNIVQDVLKKIEKEYENIEILITMNVQTKKNIEEILLRERKNIFGEDVSNILSNLDRNDVFISLLLRHIEKDVRRVEDRLSMLTDKITPLRNATDEISIKVLADTRAERNKSAKEKEKLILVREELVNGLILHRHEVVRGMPKSSVKLKRSQSVRAQRKSDMFENYERKATEVENLSDEIKQQINIKIRLSSVREAVSLTEKEIKVEGSSFGYNRKKGSMEIAADLFDPTKKPDDWTTLSEHVKEYLKANQLEFKTKHDEFCTRFKENCKAIQERARRDFLIQFGSLEPGRMALSLGNTIDDKNAMRFSTRWLFGIVSEKDCDDLCEQLSEHILDMADEIVKAIQGQDEIPRTLHSKVYICYEEHVSEELMPVLCKLFEQSYRIQCEELSAWIEKYAETELDSINMTFRNLFPDEMTRISSAKEMTERRNDVQRSSSFLGSVVGRFHKTSNRTLNFFLPRRIETFSDPSTKTPSEILNSRFKFAFENFFTLIKEEDDTISIFSKLRQLTRAVQSAEKTYSELRAANNQSTEICTDDMLDILILLICRLDPQDLLKLYTHVNLTLHMSPYFVQGTINEYSLVTLSGAFVHLFERQQLHEKSVQNIWKQNLI